MTLCKPKSERSRRTVSLPPVAIAALRAHRERQIQFRLTSGDQWHEPGLVFTTRDGTPLIARNVDRSYTRALQRAGLSHKRFHDLRHIRASLLLAQGVDSRTIMETLSHSQISRTLNIYAHVIPALQQEAARRMNDVLAGMQ